MTIAEIMEAAGKQPELKTAILSSFKNDFITGATAEGMIIRTKEQDQAHLDNQIAVLLPGKVDEKFNAKFKENLDAIDGDIKTLTGIEKKPNEKTTDYAKRAMKEFHDKGGDPVTKQKVAELENLVSTQKADYEKKLQAANETLFTREREWDVNGALEGRTIAVPPHIKEDKAKQEFTNMQKSLIRQGFMTAITAKKDDQGNIVYYDGDKALLNTSDGKPMKAADIIDSKFTHYFVPKSQQATGTGSGGGSGTGGGGFKTTDDVHAHLKAQGVDATSDDYKTQFKQICTDNKIDI